MPLDFWTYRPMREALASRHMGRVIRAYRTHPHHGRKPLSQEVVAGWMSITQAQLSRIENGIPMSDINKLARWAEALKVPSAFLWFIDDASVSSNNDTLKRSEFLKLAGMAVSAPSLIPIVVSARRVYSENECAQWLAMELWQRRREWLHVDEVPIEISASLICYVTASSTILRDAEGRLRFAHPSFVDFYIAQKAFAAISSGSAGPFASMQTSHETDLVIREFVARDSSSVVALTTWMRQAESPVLRVNSGGILAKLGSIEADEVLEALMLDPDMRHLYLTAVISRVLQVQWNEASRLSALVSTSDALLINIAHDHARYMADTFSAEAKNPRDTVARWCSILVLSRVQAVAHEPVKQALQSALALETSTVNLRSIGNVLAGSNPLDV